MSNKMQINIVKSILGEFEIKIEKVIIHQLIKLKIIKNSSEYYNSSIREELIKFDTESKYGVLIYLNKIFILGLTDVNSSFENNTFTYSIRYYELQPKKIFLDLEPEKLFK